MAHVGKNTPPLRPTQSLLNLRDDDAVIGNFETDFNRTDSLGRQIGRLMPAAPTNARGSQYDHRMSRQTKNMLDVRNGHARIHRGTGRLMHRPRYAHAPLPTHTLNPPELPNGDVQF